MKPKLITFRLLESDSKGKKWEVVLIQEGWSANGIYYPIEVLEKAIPLFEGVQASAYEFDGKLYDHLPDPVRNSHGEAVTENIIGFFTNVRVGKIPESDRRGLLATFVFSGDSAHLQQIMVDAWNEGLKNFLGFSIDAEGKTEPGLREGREGLIATEFTSVAEVTLVSHPAAGGQFTRLAASANQKFRGAKMNLLEILRLFLEGLDSTPFEGLAEDAFNEAKADEILGTMIEASTGLTAGILKKLRSMLKNNKVDEALEFIKSLEAKEDKPKESGDPPPPANTDGDPPPPASNTDIEEKLQKLDEAERRIDKKISSFDEKTKLQESQVLLHSTLAECKLPKPQVEMIRKRFTGIPFEEKRLTEAIAEAETALAETLASMGYGKPQGLGDSGILGVDDYSEARFREATFSMLNDNVQGEITKKDGTKEKVDGFISLKEAYRHISGDLREPDAEDILFESFFYMPKFAKARQWDTHESRAFKAFMNFKESITTSTFGEILGDSITRKMMKDYEDSDLQVWRKLASEIAPIKDFRTNRRLIMGGYGVLPTVSEQGTYTELTSPTDTEATYAIAKRGGLEYLTMESIADDDLGALKRIPKELANAAIQTLYRHIFDRFVANADGIASGTLLGSTALGPASLSAARIAMKDIAAYGNAYRILGDSNQPKFLLVPNELEEAAMQLTTAQTYVNPLGTVETVWQGASTNPNIHSQYGLEYITIPYWTDATDWWLVANPSKVPTIEVGFYKGRQAPELFIQDQVNMGSVFTADKIGYKIRFIFGSVTLRNDSFFGAVV